MAKTINTPGAGDDGLRSRLEGLTSEEKDELLEMLKQDKKERYVESIYGNKEAVIKYFKENCVGEIKYKIDMDNAMPIEGKMVHVDLPAKGDFKGFKFDYFESDGHFNHLFLKMCMERELFSVKEIGELLQSIKVCMEAFGVDIDGDIDDYERELKHWDKHGGCCEAGEILKKITDLSSDYLMEDRDEQNNDIVLQCKNGECRCGRHTRDGYYACALLGKIL